MFYLRRLIDRFTAAGQGFVDHTCTLLAAAIAYYLAFSLYPLILVLAAGLSWTFEFTAIGQNAQQRVLAAIAQQASPALAEQVKQTLTSVSNRAATGGLVGVIVLVVAAVAIFTHVDYAFDRIWSASIVRTVGWRSWLGRLLFVRLKALLMLVGVGAFIILVMIASVAMSALQSAIVATEGINPYVLQLVQPLAHMGLNLLAFTAVYRFVPRVLVSWRAAVAGGGIAALLWELGRQALSIYLVRHDLPGAYGIVGSFMAIMLWTYYAMLAVLFGAEYVRVVNEEQRPNEIAAAAMSMP